MIRSDNTIRRIHAKTTCTATDLILVDSGVACANCGILVIEHRGQNETQKNKVTVESRIG